MSVEFPQHNVGEVRGVEGEYAVHWISEDLVFLTIDGDNIFEFSSTSEDGFYSVEDVIDQSQDVVSEYDASNI